MCLPATLGPVVGDALVQAPGDDGLGPRTVGPDRSPEYRPFPGELLPSRIRRLVLEHGPPLEQDLVAGTVGSVPRAPCQRLPGGSGGGAVVGVAAVGGVDVVGLAGGLGRRGRGGGSVVALAVPVPPDWALVTSTASTLMYLPARLVGSQVILTVCAPGARNPLLHTVCWRSTLELARLTLTGALPSRETRAFPRVVPFVATQSRHTPSKEMVAEAPLVFARA